MILCKVIRSRHGTPRSKSGSPTTITAWIGKTTSKNTYRVMGPGRHFTKNRSHTILVAWIWQKTPKLHQKVMFRPGRGPNPIAVTLVTNPSNFIKWSQAKILGLEGIARSQSSSGNRIVGWNGQKRPKSFQEFYVLLWQGIPQLIDR